MTIACPIHHYFDEAIAACLPCDSLCSAEFGEYSPDCNRLCPGFINQGSQTDKQTSGDVTPGKEYHWLRPTETILLLIISVLVCVVVGLLVYISCMHRKKKRARSPTGSFDSEQVPLHTNVSDVSGTKQFQRQPSDGGPRSFPNGQTAERVPRHGDEGYGGSREPSPRSSESDNDDQGPSKL